jgi:arylsulfatase A-like enzyme
VHAGEINRRFLRWLDTRDSARPFFVFLNYYDVHGPYMPPPPFDKFGPPRTKDPIRRKFFDPSAPLPSPRDVAAEVGAYDGTLAWVDDRVGALIDDLGRRGLLTNTVVIITSDHGEEFGEHSVFGHGHSLYLPSVHVPLVMFYPPRIPAVRVAETVSLRDLPSTVVDLVGASGASSFPGHSLTRFWDGSAPSLGPRDPIVSSVRPPDRVPPSFPVAKGEMTALAGQSHRYIHNGDGTEELYDFDRDYWEQHNLAGQEAGQQDVARFRATLKRVLPTRTVQAANAKP